MTRNYVTSEPPLNPPEAAARDDLTTPDDDRDYERWKDERVFKELYGGRP